MQSLLCINGLQPSSEGSLLTEWWQEDGEVAQFGKIDSLLRHASGNAVSLSPDCRRLKHCRQEHGIHLSRVWLDVGNMPLKSELP
jgi:hypothetical protein